MAAEFVVYGSRGSGSAPIEAALTLLGEPYSLVERGPREDHPGGSAMGQVPVVRLPNGELMTESAAILIHIADTHAGSKLSPAIDDPRRPAFLRWMTFVSAQIYALVWARDNPMRLATDAAAARLILERTAERRLFCWRYMDTELTPGRYLLGGDLTVLDLYVAVTSTWGPGRAAFTAAAPRLAEVMRRVYDDPRLRALWAERLS